MTLSLFSYEAYVNATHFKYSYIEIGFLFAAWVLFISVAIFLIGLITDRPDATECGAKLSTVSLISILIMLVIEVTTLLLS